MAQSGRGASGQPRLSPVAIVWGLVLAFGLTMAAGAAMGLTAAWSAWDVSPGALRGAAYGSVAAAGFYAARRSRGWGWLHGGLVGVLFLVVGSLALVPGFGLGQLASGAGVARLALAFVVGSVGGMMARLR